MKIGDIIYCIDNSSDDKYDDDCNPFINKDYNFENELYNNNNKYNDDSLKNNTSYTIYKIFLQSDSSKWVKEVSDSNKEDAFFELIEITDFLFNKKRFFTNIEYRKLKLKNLNEYRG